MARVSKVRDLLSASKVRDLTYSIEGRGSCVQPSGTDARHALDVPRTCAPAAKAPQGPALEGNTVPPIGVCVRVCGGGLGLAVSHSIKPLLSFS